MKSAKDFVQLALDVAHAGLLTVVFYLALQLVAFQFIATGA